MSLYPHRRRLDTQGNTLAYGHDKKCQPKTDGATIFLHFHQPNVMTNICFEGLWEIIDVVLSSSLMLCLRMWWFLGIFQRCWLNASVIKVMEKHKRQWTENTWTHSRDTSVLIGSSWVGVWPIGSFLCRFPFYHQKKTPLTSRGMNL